jgi:Cell wall-active antibiotics response 4TMS YvqF
MSDLGIGGQFHSISTSGMAIFDQPIEAMIGGVVVDLASAPIAPGEHRLEIDVTIGGIEIYLPRYVQFTVERSGGLGGQDIHEGLGLWERMTHKLRDALHLPSKIPAHAVENPDPSKPVKLVLAIDGTVGGVDIYRI